MNDLSTTALLVCDLQNDFLDPAGAYGRAGQTSPDIAALPARLAPVAAPTPTGADGLAGLYRCAELDADLVVADAGDVLHAACAGPLGQGRMEALTPLGADLWAMPCPRALDVAPPGDWTLAVRRDGAGAITGLSVGCWLARDLAYARIGAA